MPDQSKLISADEGTNNEATVSSTRRMHGFGRSEAAIQDEVQRGMPHKLCD